MPKPDVTHAVLLVRNLLPPEASFQSLQNELSQSCLLQTASPELLPPAQTGTKVRHPPYHPAPATGLPDWRQAMPEHATSTNKEEWVIWNGSLGILAMVTIGRIEESADGSTNGCPNSKNAWLDRPYDMVGPFDFDELETNGRITFAACMVMSRQRWQDDQVQLRQEAYEIRRATQKRINREYGHFFEGGGGQQSYQKPFDEQAYRATLNLPVEGELEPSQIKTAFRRRAQKVHPDVGGTHEQFIEITEARDALLEMVS
ncbi:J domain-containing protein [Ampullimonas aquatilis]|uniref:J domain-containing protein n=1 Tax=Ampullimonas aquatilis TaxID=1341549 RepID=UPI003C75B429